MADKKISALTAASTPLAGTEVAPIVQSGSTVKATAESIATATRPNGTANGVTYLNSSKVPTSGAALQFNGTNLGVAAAPAAFGVNERAVQVNATTLFDRQSGYYSTLANNTYYDGSNSKYIINGRASSYSLVNGGHYWYVASDGTAGATMSTTLSMQIDIASNLTLNVGNLKFGTAGKGVDFSANTNAPGMTSELLTWYEEGTATAVLTDGTNNATLAAGSGMIYTRIGRIVMVQGYIEVSNIGSVSGPLRISGLPFNVNSSSRSALTVGQSGGLAITAGQSMTGFGQANTNYIRLYVWTATTGSTEMTNTQLSTGGFISFSFNYVVA